MTPTLGAVIARFNGDANKAIDYCERMASAHPQLAVEYRAYRGFLTERMANDQCALSASR